MKKSLSLLWISFVWLSLLFTLVSASGQSAPRDSRETSPNHLAVTGFQLNLKSPVPDLPQDEILRVIKKKKYRLSLSEDGIFFPRNISAGESIEFSFDAAPSGVYSIEALQALQSQIVHSLQQGGYYGIVALINPEQIDPRTGEDLRPDEGGLQVDVWLSGVVEQRTVGKGKSIKKGSPVNHPRHASILKNSPLRSPEVDAADGEKQNGAVLIDRFALNTYLERLNRFPNRRVDAAASAAGVPGEVVLDYIVSETKPWFLYLQVSNTGTESTGEWRQRIGGAYYQLTNNNDILSVDYVTANLDQANAFSAAYEIALFKPDYLTFRVFGSYSDFSAENLVIPGAPEFEGETTSFGGEFRYTPLYIARHAVSVFAGIRQEDIEVENLFGASTGKAELLSPYFGMSASKYKKTHRSAFSLSYETNTNTGNDPVELISLGRLNVTDDYQLINFDLFQSFFLEPLLSGYHAPLDAQNWRTKALIHEFAFSLRGQFALDDARLIPQKQIYGGGFFSVRGYEESVTRGDSGFIASSEYRIHLARLFKPEALLRDIDDKEIASAEERKRRFNYRAPDLYGFADWNLLARAFVDYGSFKINEMRPDEVEHDLMSTGVGLEFQYKSNLNVRLDYGVVLKGLEQFDGTPIKGAEKGDSRVHVLVTLSF